MAKRLNLGGGKDAKEGYINIDVAKLPGVDIVHNLDKYPWPFKKDEFKEVYASHVLEHLSSIVKPLEEIWRITQKDGIVKVAVPIFPGIYAACDPTHKQFYTYSTFNYFEPKNKGLNYYSKARFVINKKKIIFHKCLRFFQAINISEFTQKFYAAFLSFLIPATILEVELTVVK